MILLLDTSGPLCRLTLIEADIRHQAEWEANRELAKGLLAFLEAELKKMQKEFTDISAIAAFRGPGSFTGLRIGLAVVNTLADALDVPIVGETGDAWQEKALERLKNGENQQIILPLYGSEANISLPRK